MPDIQTFRRFFIPMPQLIGSHGWLIGYGRRAASLPNWLLRLQQR